MADYLGRDLVELRTNIINNIKLTDSSFTQFSGSDPVMMIVDAMAEIADRLNYYIDASRLETYIATCQQTDSLYEIARLETYFIQGVTPPSVEVQLTATEEKTTGRTQLLFGDVPYVIVSDSTLDASNSYTDTVSAHNGVLDAIWISTNTLDVQDPILTVGSALEIPSVGLQVSIEINGVLNRLTNREYYVSRSDDDEVLIRIRDNSIVTDLDDVGRVLVEFIRIAEKDFTAVEIGSTYTTSGITYTTIEDTVEGSGDEEFATAKRNVRDSATLLDTVVSVSDYETIAKQDLLIRTAKAFDINTPSVVSDSNSVVIYLEPVDYTLATIPNAITLRLNDAIELKNSIIGVTHTWERALYKSFDITANVYTNSVDQVDEDTIKEYLLEEYTTQSFAKTIIPSKIAKNIENLNTFIEYVEIEEPSAKVVPAVNEICKVGTITVNVLRGDLDG